MHVYLVINSLFPVCSQAKRNPNHSYFLVLHEETSRGKQKISFHIISYHIILYHIISYHTISYYIISYHIISYHIISYHIISYHIISYYMISYHIILYHIISYHIISNLILISYIKTNRHKKHNIILLCGTAPPTPKLACFVLYLKIINTFLKNDICSFQKWHWNLVGQAVF